MLPILSQALWARNLPLQPAEYGNKVVAPSPDRSCEQPELSEKGRENMHACFKTPWRSEGEERQHGGDI